MALSLGSLWLRLEVAGAGPDWPGSTLPPDDAHRRLRVGMVGDDGALGGLGRTGKAGGHFTDRFDILCFVLPLETTVFLCKVIPEIEESGTRLQRSTIVL